MASLSPRVRQRVRIPDAAYGMYARVGTFSSLASPRSPNCSHLGAAPATTEELIGAIGLQARYACSGRHLKTLHDFSRLRVHPPDVAIVTFPGAVPELSIDPGN